MYVELIYKKEIQGISDAPTMIISLMSIAEDSTGCTKY